MVLAEQGSDPEFDDPLAVSDFLLEVTRKAYFDNDFGSFSKRFALPQVIGTFEGDRTIKNADDLEAVFQSMRQYFARVGVIDLNRRTLSARFLDADTVQYTAISQHILPGYALSEDILIHGILRRIDGLWRISDNRYATTIEPVMRALTKPLRKGT